MTRRTIRSLLHDDSAAVAALYAVGMIGLIAVAGIGFDFARLATMDTELQNAADQAALAAATQLDGTANAIDRATAQASGLVSNQTIMANDGEGSAVAVATLTFYETREDAEADTNGFTDNGQSADAHFVKVDINARRAFYALTPIVGAVSSGDIDAAATAGMGSSICKVPPVMMCNPNANPAVADIDALIGKGVRLKATGGGGAWAPGDFGFLDVGAGANALARLMGYANPPGDCVEVDTPTTEPGAMTSVIRTFNTRFDIFENGDGNINCYSNSLCPPSNNARKDLVQAVTGGGGGGGGGLNLNDCGIANNANQPGWKVTPSAYRPTAALRCNQQNCGALGTQYPDAMGYPRDICHAWSEAGNCAGGRIGDGVWDIDAYWRANYGAAYADQAGANPKRYDVYDWEKTNNSADPRAFTSNGTNWRAYEAPVCRPGLAAGPTTADRRVLPVAIVDCTGLNGKREVTPLDWVEVFLTEPSLDRSAFGNTYTRRGDIYVEVIRRAGQGTGGTGNQYVRRDKPFLVR